MVDRAQVVPGPGQFSQRSDQNPGQPVRVPTGLPYGDRKRQEQAQSAVPLPSGAGGSSSPPGAGPAPTPSASPPPTAPQPIPANIMDILSHPTQRPAEPVTAPSSMGQSQVSSYETVAQLVNKAADLNPDSSDLQYLRAFVNGGR